MSSSHITLIDLTKQLPFEIDEKLKSELCFAETLIISCAHCESESEIGDFSDSESTCFDTTESEISEEVKENTVFETKENAKEEAEPEELPEEDNDFHFYFFPDCNKPVPKQNSEASVITVDGIPKINLVHKINIQCSCVIDKHGHCSCYTKLPCRCGAKTDSECACSKLAEICTCHEGQPQPECTCKGSSVCLCHPELTMQPTCPCDDINKPCICDPNKFPNPVCECKHKPTIESEEVFCNEGPNMEKSIEVRESANMEEKCVCQENEPAPLCRCAKGEECICKDICVCELQKLCVCDPAPSRVEMCKSDNMSICACDDKKDCTCDNDENDCKCFPVKQCSCGNPDDCKCFLTCDCTEPCVCDIATNEDQYMICTCTNKIQDGKKPDCVCRLKREGPKKLKRVRAGKHGYRWCHDVDPKHTYFDYAYDRHDKISYKEPPVEKVKILGLHEEKTDEEISDVHGVVAPVYKKKVQKPSIDCCSSVGGISICVETLGEDKDKFLVQTVSHSSKEGSKCGSKLVSILDCNLHTMEENRTEHLSSKGVTKERRNYMAVCESGYYNKITRICGEKHVIKRLYHTFEAAQNFLLEGANIVLLRYFGLRRYRGNVKTETILMNGTICESIYVCQGVSQAVVNGKPLFVVKVERHVIEPNGFVHQTLTVLTLRGYTVSHEWADNSCILHLNPLLRVVPEKDEIEPHVPLRENWREDLQLLSDYLDYKSVRTSEGGRYTAESGTLTNTIREYLQALLLLRPHDALHFTRHYFGAALSALDLPHDDYFDPASKHVRYYFFEQ